MHLGQTSHNTNHTLSYFVASILKFFGKIDQRYKSRLDSAVLQLFTLACFTICKLTLPNQSQHLFVLFFLRSIIISNRSQQDYSLLLSSQALKVLQHNVVVVLLTGGGGSSEAGVAGDGEPEHPVQLHLVPVHLLLLLLPLEGPQPPDMRGAIAGHLLTFVPLVSREQAWGSAIRLHPGSYLGAGRGKVLFSPRRKDSPGIRVGQR